MAESITAAPVGAIRGEEADGIVRYLGIPYAAPPARERRFRHAEPVSAHSGILDALVPGPKSPQHGRMPKDEAGCLTLNIWAPKDARRLPVYFFIHGGSFIYGSGTEQLYDGTHLARAGRMIVVTFNYRLGALGCMDFSHLSSRFQGNCAYTDMTTALAWVYENIEAFGGDPEQITVAGQSAGAIAASAFPVDPALRPMVSKVVMMSGSPTYLRSQEEQRDVSQQFFEYAGFSDPEELLTADAHALAAAGRRFQHDCGLGEGTFMLAVDGDTIPVSPITAALQGAAAGIPVLLGTTREEMAFVTSPLFSEALDVKNYIDDSLKLEDPQTLRAIENVYERDYGKRGRSLFIADRAFRMGSLWYGQVLSEYAPAWLYRFDYEARAMRLIGLRACHSSDLPLFFGNIQTGFFRFMYILDCIQKSYRMVMDEMQTDIFRFVHEGSLPWESCTRTSAPAKIYDRNVRYEDAMAPHIRKAFETTRFYSETFGTDRSAAEFQRKVRAC